MKASDLEGTPLKDASPEELEVLRQAFRRLYIAEPIDLNKDIFVKFPEPVVRHVHEENHYEMTWEEFKDWINRGGM